jgi:hypothetical protein
MSALRSLTDILVKPDVGPLKFRKRTLRRRLQPAAAFARTHRDASLMSPLGKGVAFPTRRAKHLLFSRTASSPRRKNKSLCEKQKQTYIPCHPALATEGVSRTPRDVARGAMDAKDMQAMHLRRVRPSRVVLSPRRWGQANEDAISPLSAATQTFATEANKPGLWGERGATVTPLRREWPCDFGPA